MKVVCRKAFKEPSKGFLGIGAHGLTHIDGLTEGQVYEAAPVAIVNNWSDQTNIEKSDYKFLIFNDNNEWATYDLNLFRPE